MAYLHPFYMQINMYILIKNNDVLAVTVTSLWQLQLKITPIVICHLFNEAYAFIWKSTKVVKLFIGRRFV